MDAKNFAGKMPKGNKIFGNLKNLGIFVLVVVGIVLMLSGSVSAYSAIGGGICNCGNNNITSGGNLTDACADCSAALNDNTYCSNQVNYVGTVPINNYAGTCINDPPNFNNKVFDCQWNTIDGDDSYPPNDYGIFLNGNSNNTIRNCVITEFWSGIFLYLSDNNTIINNTVNLNNIGIMVGHSSDNTVVNNTAKENSQGDLYISTEFNSHCNNIIENNTGSGDRPIKFFNSSVDLQNKILSKLILCNADNSNINNVTVTGSDSLKNNDVYVWGTDHSNLTNINSSNNFFGILLVSSSNNTLTNNTMNNNTYNFNINGWQNSHFYHDIDTSNLVDNKPIYYWTNEKNAPNGCKNTLISELNNTGFVALISCDNITVKNLNLTKNFNGILLVNTTNSKILNNTASSNNFGIYLYSSTNNTLTNNTANSNNNGIYISYSSSNKILNSMASFNQWNGIYLYISSKNTIINNILIHNNLNYTELNITGFTINFTHPTPENNSVVNNSFLTINISSNVNVEEIVFNWNGSEEIIAVYGKNWNYLKEDLPNGDYFYELHASSCDKWTGIKRYLRINDTIPPEITESINIYTQETSAKIIWNTNEICNSSINYGENISLESIYENSSMRKYHHIYLSNLSCGTTYYYNITLCDSSGNCNTLGTYNFTISCGGIVSGSSSSVLPPISVARTKIKGHCTNTGGIYAYLSPNNTMDNNFMENNKNGVYLSFSSNNNITDNEISNNTNGVYIYYNSNNNNIADNKIQNNSIGIFSESSSSIINNNTVCGNTNLDFNSSAWQSIGDNNTCDNADGWHDTSVPNGGCKNSCAQPSINLSKTANVSSLPAGGGSVTYYYNVTNTGNVPLNNVNVDDNKCSPINCPGTTLAVGASIKCNCTTPITQTTTNIANVTASYMQTQVSASASATVNVSPCDIDISILNLTFNPKKPVNGFILNLNVSINSTITATTNVTLTIDGNLTENKTINLLLGINYAEFTVLAKSGVHNVSVHVVPFDCDNNLSNNEYNKTYNASTPILLVKRTIGNLTKANETFNITFSGTPTPPGNWTMENMTNITFNYSKSLLAYGAKKIGTGKVVMTYKGSVTVSNSYSDNGTFIVYTPSSASNERQSRNVTIKMMDNSNPVASGNCNNLSQCTFLYDNNNTETISLEFSVPPGTHILYYEINITTDINNFNYTIQSLNKSSNNAYLQNDWLTQWTPEIQSMAQNLTQNCSSDFEKVGKISRWVYENINYDINLAGVANNASWVFANRTGVCAHYTNLLISMCRSINISARGVYGDVYNSSSYLGGHAWAEVFMDGKWYAVDPTFNEIGFIDSGHLSAGYDLSTLKSSYFSASLYGLTYIGSNIYYPDLKVLNTANITSVSQIIDITPKWRVANVVGSTVTYEITGLFNNSRGQGYIIGNAYLWTVGGSTLLSDYTHQVYVGQNESNASWRFNIILPGLSSGSDYTLPLTISTDPTPVNSANFNALTAPTFEIYNAQVPATIQQGTTTLNVTVRNIGVRNGNTAVTFYIDNSLNATNNLNVAGISETNATQFILNTASLSQGIHTIKFAVGSDVFTKTITVGQLTCNISDNSPCPSNQFCNSSSQCQNLNCSANQTAYNHGCINCVPFDLDGNNVKDIFDVVAGLEHLSEGKNISNEGCTAKDGHEINLFDLLTLIDRIGTNTI